MSAAEQPLVDALMESGLAVSPGNAGAILFTLTLTGIRVELVRWLGDTIGLDTLVAALVDAYGPDAWVHALADTGTLVAVPGRDSEYRWIREAE